VVEFFNRFVGDYGHGSILEATGSPVVYSDGLSWYSSYLLFDGPLVIGQENSTRAVTKSDWPMCREAHVSYDTVKAERDAHYDQRRDTALTMTEVADSQFFQHLEKIVGVIHPGLQELHEGWMQVFVAEKEAWEERLKDPVIRQAHGIKDKEAFRPSLDRARWALPGTISTGVAFASHIRERSRALRDAKSVAGGAKEAWDVFDEIEQAYRAAVPGIGALGLKEAVYGSGGRVPTHLLHGIVDDAGEGRAWVPGRPLDAELQAGRAGQGEVGADRGVQLDAEAAGRRAVADERAAGRGVAVRHQQLFTLAQRPY
jgi:hypothetical protein